MVVDSVKEIKRRIEMGKSTILKLTKVDHQVRKKI